MPEKSLLEKTNSWVPFWEKIHRAIDTHDYRKSTIHSILAIVDPTISMNPGSVWNRVKGMLFGPGFTAGREALYQHVFKQFLAQKMTAFENAPQEVIETFNLLLRSLFTPQTASQLSLNMALARPKTKTEAFIRHVEKARHQLSLPSMEKIPSVAPQSTPMSTLPETLQQQIQSVIPLALQETAHIKAIEKAVEQFRKMIYQLYPTVAFTKQIVFTDIRNAIQQYTTYTLEDEFLQELFHESDLNNVRKRLESFGIKRLEEVGNCLKTLEQRNEKLSWINEEKTALRKLIEPFLSNINFKGDFEAAFHAITSTPLPEAVFSSINPQEIETLLTEQTNLLIEQSNALKKSFQQLRNKISSLEQEANFRRLIIMVFCWEIMSETTPYPDLQPIVSTTRAKLIKQFDRYCQEFIAGNILLNDFSEFILEILYDPNIKFIRGELTARASRLTDLRNAVVEELLTVKRYAALAKLTSCSIDFEADLTWLSTLFSKLLHPYTIYKDCNTPESMDRLFQYWWMDIERFKRSKESMFIDLIMRAEKNASHLVEPIAKTLVTISESSYHQGTSMPNDMKEHTNTHLYQSFREEISNKTGALLVSSIERWLKDHSTSLEEKMIPQLSCMSEPAPLQETVERIMFLKTQIDETISFARDIQAIKTFEPERIDSMLELFSIFPTFSPTQVTLLEKATSLLNESLIIELGVIDKKARLEHGGAVERLIPHALLKIRPLLDTMLIELTSLSIDPDPLIAKIAVDLHKKTSLIATELPTLGFEAENLFPVFQKLAVLIFYKNMLLTAKASSSPPVLLDTAADFLSLPPQKGVPHFSFVPGDLSFFISRSGV